MATLTGALVAVWTVICILIAIFLTIAAISCLVCTVSPAGTNLSRIDAFSGFIPCFLLAGLFYIHIGYLLGNSQKHPGELEKTRDIHLTVPEKVRVHTEFRLDNTVIGKEVL